MEVKLTEFKKSLLLILDGWGYRKEKQYNAIANANTPHYDYLIKKYPSSLLSACGENVGLPRGQFGNSEVGHMHIGTGTLIDQLFNQINKTIYSGDFKKRFQFIESCNGTVHLIGLVSNGGVHSHLSHWVELLEQYADKPIVLHLFTDGRDCSPQAALKDLQVLFDVVDSNPNHQIGSLGGRFFGMDRDNRWERTQKAYDTIVESITLTSMNPSDYVKKAYQQGLSDEFIEPVSFQKIDISQDDIAIMMNFRPDRMVQITSMLMNKMQVYTLSDYNLKTDYIYKIDPPTVCLGSILSDLNLKQSRIAETEKFPHVTYFLNGGRHDPYPGESRFLVPSPDVKTYNLCPKMSCEEVTEHIIQQMEYSCDCIIANYANADMVGHTGDYDATISAIEHIDKCLQRIYEHAEKYQYELLICADHGNAEWMYKPENGTQITSHTSSPVPFLYCGNGNLKPRGTLQDILPTMLNIMNIAIPEQITGSNLWKEK